MADSFYCNFNILIFNPYEPVVSVDIVKIPPLLDAFNPYGESVNNIVLLPDAHNIVIDSFLYATFTLTNIKPSFILISCGVFDATLAL